MALSSNIATAKDFDKVAQKHANATWFRLILAANSFIVLQQVMKKILIILFLLFSSSVFSEIVTLEDGRIIDLKEDGTFTLISKEKKHINNKFHNSIIFMIDAMELDYETINFLDDSSFVIKNISMEGLKIEELNLVGLNKEYFLNFNLKNFNSYKGQFFEKLSIKNYSLIEGESFKNKVSLIEVSKFNIKNIAILKKFIEHTIFDIAPPPDVGEILSLIDSISLDKVTINNFDLIDPNLKGGWGSLVINNFKNSSLGNLYYLDGEFNDGNQFLRVDNLEIDNLLFNRPSTYNINWNENMFLADPLLLFSFFKSLKSFRTSGYYQKNFISGIEVLIDEYKITDVNTKKINNYSVPISLKLKISDGQISVLSDLANNELEKLNYNEISFDHELILDWNTTYNTFSLNSRLGINDAFDLNIDVEINNLDENLLNPIGTYPDFLNSLRAEPGIKAVRISLQDKGLTNRLINLGALEFKVSKSEFIDQIVDQIESDEMIESALKDDFIIKLIKFLKKPDKIELSINPSTSLSFEDLSTLVTNPNLLVELLNLEMK